MIICSPSSHRRNFIVICIYISVGESYVIKSSRVQIVSSISKLSWNGILRTYSIGDIRNQLIAHIEESSRQSSIGKGIIKSVSISFSNSWALRQNPLFIGHVQIVYRV